MFKYVIAAAAIFAATPALAETNVRISGSIIGGSGYQQPNYYRPVYRPIRPRRHHEMHPSAGYNYGRKQTITIQADPNDPRIGPHKRSYRCTRPQTGEQGLCVVR